ncbi:MAG TPA: 2-succinyl-5-enolpyruvyl-6-hydroxy-3-cyclohexene-1-carboxylic-acid synthase [Kofleriaceae bacterium]|nr:2-succinyl-5-enolpyruvyl-6-hydroxy-3-cyclohexene-1-carboxylic-acid synthase [Kofleriaceae bacterium]
MTAAVQTVWAELVAASLADAGVADVVVSPGSRSTPLAAALARLPVRLHVVVDERAAAFFALGIARADGAPAALVCTSGTAPAHYLPAVIEASMSGVPLVIVSADRPPELHGAGASQTIDQTKLFGGFVRRFDDLGPPDGSALALRSVRRKIGQAVAASRGPAPGPVHVNVPLRKPLEPAAPSTVAERTAAAEATRLRTLPIAAVAPTVRVPDDVIARVAEAIAGTTRGVLLATAGPASRREARAAAFTLARHAGWPVLAEAGSQLRFAPRDGILAVDHAGLAASAELAPEVIVQLGGEPVAMGWGAIATGARRFIIAEHGWPDGDSTAEAVLVGDVADTLARITAALATPRLPSAYARAWRDADRVAADAIAAALAEHAAANTGLAAEHAMVGAAIAAVPTGAQLVLGNSLPVRVADEIAGGGRDLTVLTQRGAAGIDGLIAGAAGAAARNGATVLVLGDVSFAHDVGALACARGLPLAIVVIDNGGGRIFDQLPVVASDLPDGAFERLWRTPTALDPVAAARAFGIEAALVRDPDELGAAIDRGVGRGAAGPVVIHAPVAPESAASIRRAAKAALSTPARQRSHA